MGAGGLHCAFRGGVVWISFEGVLALHSAFMLKAALRSAVTLHRPMAAVVKLESPEVQMSAADWEALAISIARNPLPCPVAYVVCPESREIAAGFWTLLTEHDVDRCIFTSEARALTWLELGIPLPPASRPALRDEPHSGLLPLGGPCV